GSYNADGKIPEAKSNADSEDGIPGRLRTLPLVDTPRVILPPVTPGEFTLPLPPGWRLTVTTPIQYRASGYCTGGTAELEIGTQQYTYLIKPPLCEVALEH